MKKFRGVFIKNEREIDLLRKANGITARILDELVANVRPGVPTMLFEDICQKMCREYGVKPAFQGYGGFPYALCCSVNETVVHGFPSRERILKEGDIVSFDMGVVYEGFHGDSARTALVGEVSEEAKHLSRVTEECLHLGIAAARPGNDLYAISAAVQRHAEEEGPEIPNFVPEGAGEGVPLKAGMVLAIEPMLAVGTHEVEILSDGWTANMKDKKFAAHWEHSVVIHADGAEILSLASNA